MPYSILCDEHVPRQVARHLGREGHDVERVVGIPELGEGSTDTEIRTYARNTNRLVLTSDEGFLRAAPQTHAGLLFQPDDKLPAHEVSTIVTRIAEQIPQEDIERAVYVTRDWL